MFTGGHRKSMSDLFPTVSDMHQLSEDDQAILDFEAGGWWKYAGAKDTAIREHFDISATVYFQRLNAIIDRPEALAYDPLLVRRLVRLRERRRTQRVASHRLEFMPGVDR